MLSPLEEWLIGLVCGCLCAVFLLGKTDLEYALWAGAGSLMGVFINGTFFRRVDRQD